MKKQKSSSRRSLAHRPSCEHNEHKSKFFHTREAQSTAIDVRGSGESDQEQW
jgi:hypothetical protein